MVHGERFCEFVGEKLKIHIRNYDVIREEYFRT